MQDGQWAQCCQHCMLHHFTELCSNKTGTSPSKCNFNDNCLWQKISTETVLLTCLICGSHGGCAFSSCAGHSSAVEGQVSSTVNLRFTWWLCILLLCWSLLRCLEGRVSSTVIIVCWIHGRQLRVIKRNVLIYTTHIIWSQSVSAINIVKYKPRINMKFNFTTQLCFLQDCYLPFEHVILMTTDYDRKLVQKLAILTLCRSNLKHYCMGRKAVFFSVGI